MRMRIDAGMPKNEIIEWLCTEGLTKGDAEKLFLSAKKTPYTGKEEKEAPKATVSTAGGKVSDETFKNLMALVEKGASEEEIEKFLEKKRL
jgi:hypothetical protein